MSRLLANLGTPDQWEIPLVPGAYLLGRGADNHFSIDHPSISHAHCEVVVTEEGLVTVKDLGSANGTFIDLAPVQECELRSGQTLRLGEVELLYDADTPDDLTAVAPTPSPPAAVSAAADPPLPPPISTALAMCRNHPRAIARLQCGQCRSYYCDLCVSVLPGGRFCRRCGGQCLDLNPDVRLQVEDIPEFFAAMRSAFAYPFQGDGWILIIAGGLFFTVLGLSRYVMGFGFLVMAAALVVSVFAAGYLFSYLQRIITTSAAGEKQLPDWPDFSGFDDVIGPCLQFGAAIFGCFLPAIAVLILAGSDSEWAGQLIWPALLFGCFYLPMAFLAVAMFDTVTALNPILIIPSITRVFKEYLVACGLLILILALRFGINVLFSVLFLPMTHDIGMMIVGALVQGLISGFLGLYFLTVEMRILGLLYYTKKAELGWFNR
jgi:hypothetical protein